MNYFDDETPRHKKKSQAKPPKKASHKHVFEPFILEYPKDWYKKPHEQSGEKCAQFYGYCPMCGKVGYIDDSCWWTSAKKCRNGFRYYDRVPTEEGVRELNPETRTLPIFFSDNPFVKFVDIN